MSDSTILTEQVHFCDVTSASTRDETLLNPEDNKNPAFKGVLQLMKDSIYLIGCRQVEANDEW